MLLNRVNKNRQHKGNNNEISDNNYDRTYKLKSNS